MFSIDLKSVPNKTSHQLPSIYSEVQYTLSDKCYSHVEKNSTYGCNQVHDMQINPCICKT